MIYEKKKQKKILMYDDLIAVCLCVYIFATKVSRRSKFEEYVIVEEYSSEFNIECCEVVMREAKCFLVH